ncbi:hypothetical protein K1719_015251 [Acacia pycnantha]|nr:hypothetical protein K1719_015251 [Acacia pycnantha]
MFLPGWVAQVEAAQVEPEVKEGQLLHGANVGGQVLCIPRKLRETQTEHSSSILRMPQFQGSHEKLPYCDFFKWVDDSGNDSMELEDSRLNKLELNNAEVEFKLNYMEMKLNDELQVKLNEHRMKIREQQRKMIELSMKMVAEFDRVEKEIRLWVGGLGCFFVIVVVGAICIYVGVG